MPRCNNKNCPYDRDGRCIENLLPNCPNLVSDKPADSVEQETKPGIADKAPITPQYEDIYSGKKLTVAEVTRILQSCPARVVVLGGMVESGKTTLLARIFEMFQSKCVSDYRFAASRTLPEYDKLSWYATMESGAASPTTEHTYRSENNHFLHLRLRAKDGLTPPTDLLINDIPGEVFPEAVAEKNVCFALSALHRADHLVLFLDGEVLCDIANRHDPCGKVFDFVTQALGTKQVGLHTVLHLAISKSDKLPGGPENEVMTYLKSTEQMFKDQFSDKFAKLYFWRIAARPVHPVEPTLADIEKIFGIWMNSSYQNTEIAMEAPQRNSFKRDFCRFGL